MDSLAKILDAANFAAQKHKGQKRKGKDAEPYINHPVEVSDILTSVGKIDDVDIIAAGLLHDTVEDCGVSYEEIEKRFGATVAGYVRELTDDKSLPRAERERLQIEHALNLSHGAKQVKLADKISNIRGVTENPPVDWDLKRRREYVEWGEKVVAGLRGANADLEKEFDAVVEKAKRSMRSEPPADRGPQSGIPTGVVDAGG